MKIYVDADACPVKNIIVNIAKTNKIPVVMVCDTSHILNDGYSKIITVDKASDSADLVLVNLIGKGDIVITQDYGVGCLAISKGAYALNQNGILYTKDNIDRMLFERFLSKKVRMSGGKTKNQSKRTEKDNLSFENAFKNLLKEVHYIGSEEN